MSRSSPQQFRSSSRTKKPRSRSRTEQMVWGIHPVLEALQTCPQAIAEIFVDRDKSGRRIEQIVELAQQEAVPVHEGSDGIFAVHKKSAETIEPEKSQGVAARISMPSVSLDTLLGKLAALDGPPLILALDSIQDPHNLGAIIRSAVAAGVNGIILPKDRSAPITGTVIKTSAGSVFHIDICRVTNLVNCFKVLKENSIWIFGAAKDADRPVFDVDLTVPLCLVIGSEGRGLRPLVAERCDLSVSIPMRSSLDSLNASVAAGIILFETVRQRVSQNR